MYKIKQPLLRLISLLLCCCCLLSFVPSLSVSSKAAESDLQADFNNGLMTLKTGFAYHKIGSGYNVLNSFDSTSNNISPYYDFDYVFGKYQNNTLKRYAYRFQISYNDNRVLMPQGEAISFSIHNFYSQFYWGLYDPENFDVTRYMYLDVSKYIDSFVYFVDLAGNSYAVSDDMYEISFNQDEAMITVKLKSDIYDFDVYAIRFYVCFDVNAFYIYQNDIIVGWATDSWYDAYDSFYVSYGYSNLFLEISSDTEAATKGLLTSIIEYIKSIWDSIKNLPENIKESFTSLFEGLSSSISGFFNSLKARLIILFKDVTDGISNLYYSIAGRGEPGDSDYIPSLWQRIIDGIKGLFVPDDDYVDEWRESLSLTLEEHLGIVYQVPAITVDLFRNLVSYSPFYPDTDGEYYFKLPTVRLYINLNNLGHDLDVFSSTDNSSQYGESIRFQIFGDNSGGKGFYYYYFDFLEENPYSFFYSVYKIFSYFIVLMLFLNYGWNKANQLFST